MAIFLCKNFLLFLKEKYSIILLEFMEKLQELKSNRVLWKRFIGFLKFTGTFLFSAPSNDCNT